MSTNSHLNKDTNTIETNNATNGKVSTAEFYKELLALRKELGEMELRIIARIDCIQAPALLTRIQTLADDVENCQDEIKQVRQVANWWNGANSFGAIIAAIRAFIGP